MDKLQPGDIIALDIKGKDVFGYVRGASESGANIVFLDYALSNHRAVMLGVNDTEGEFFDNEELETCKATVLLTAQEYLENLWRLEHPDERPCGEIVGEIVENSLALAEGRQVPTYRIVRVEPENGNVLIPGLPPIVDAAAELAKAREEEKELKRFFSEDKSGITLDNGRYFIAWHRIRTESQLLEWVLHLCEKEWMDERKIACLIEKVSRHFNRDPHSANA